jgi:hypothetical protein
MKATSKSRKEDLVTISIGEDLRKLLDSRKLTMDGLDSTTIDRILNKCRIPTKEKSFA